MRKSGFRIGGQVVAAIERAEDYHNICTARSEQFQRPVIRSKIFSLALPPANNNIIDKILETSKFSRRTIPHRKQPCSQRGIERVSDSLVAIFSDFYLGDLRLVTATLYNLL